MRLEHSFVQREDATAHLSHLETGQGLAVDFHPAVKHIDLGEQLALRTDGLHCSAEFGLPMMGKDHVLQQNGLVLRDPRSVATLATSCAPITRWPRSCPFTEYSVTKPS